MTAAAAAAAAAVSTGIDSLGVGVVIKNRNKLR